MAQKFSLEQQLFFGSEFHSGKTSVDINEKGVINIHFRSQLESTKELMYFSGIHNGNLYYEESRIGGTAAKNTSDYRIPIRDIVRKIDEKYIAQDVLEAYGLTDLTGEQQIGQAYSILHKLVQYSANNDGLINKVLMRAIDEAEILDRALTDGKPIVAHKQLNELFKSFNFYIEEKRIRQENLLQTLLTPDEVETYKGMPNLIYREFKDGAGFRPFDMDNISHSGLRASYVIREKNLR